MKYNPDIHHRRSVRLQDYDYSHAGAYFVTICTFERECLFGEIIDGKMCLTAAGVCIEKWWHLLPERYPDIEIDAFVVMPNHIHGIILIKDATVGAVPVGAVPVRAIHELPLRHLNIIQN